MARVKELLELKDGSKKPEVKVVYLLVCPEGETPNKWQLPVDWDEGISKNDHRGDALCMRVPIPGASYLFTPNLRAS
jgi:hypothetical protein